MIPNLISTAGKAVGNWLGNKAVNTVLKPIDGKIDEDLTEISTTIGSFIVRKIRGKFQRSITFEIGVSYNDDWMEEALYGILYEYNDIKNYSRIHLSSVHKPGKASDIYSKLDDGAHTLKYRQWNILLCVQTKDVQQSKGRIKPVVIYTVITYDMSPDFVKMFEKDMRRHRNALLQINADSPTLNVYRDGHENDGYTYWEMSSPIPKRKLNTIYLPKEQIKRIVDVINNFFASKEFYHEHGIPWNLKILFHGPAGTGKTSLVKMIASEWNRNLFEASGGKNGQFIPESITMYSEAIIAPLFSISDIDKYPTLINEADTDMSKDDNQTEDRLKYKQQFNNMINALDGVNSGENRIIIMTTNHIDKFSETFLRPGRIDLIEEIGYVVPEVFCRFVRDFYGVKLPDDITLREEAITIAEMQTDVVYRKLTIDEFISKYTVKSNK